MVGGEEYCARRFTPLQKLPYVEDFRLGGPGEGGYGVTIVRFINKGGS